MGFFTLITSLFFITKFLILSYLKDVSASVSLPSTAPSSRSSTPDAGTRSTATSLPATLTSFPLLHARRNSSAASHQPSYQQRVGSVNTRSRNTAFSVKSSAKSAPVFSKYSSTTYRSSLRKSPKRSGTSSRVSFVSSHQNCLVNEQTKGDCHHFPCILPSSYNHFGYVSPNDEEVQTHSVGMSASAQRRMFRALDAKSARRPLRSNMQNKSKLREDGLYKQVHHMRWKNELTKPPDWNQNYGKPTPLRKVLKPARATALEVS